MLYCPTLPDKRHVFLGIRNPGPAGASVSVFKRVVLHRLLGALLARKLVNDPSAERHYTPRKQEDYSFANSNANDVNRHPFPLCSRVQETVGYKSTQRCGQRERDGCDD